MKPSYLVQALTHTPQKTPPVWLMRQAGRYLPEYRAIRSQFKNFLEFCLTPDAATEVTLQPISRFDLDAAIIFADILTIPHALGHEVMFTEGEGPRVQPFNKPEQLHILQQRLPEITARLAPISQTIKNTRAALPPHKAVIGFSGGPFTLACYMVDIKPSQGIPNLLRMMEEDSTTFANLIGILTEAIITYTSQQIEAGANAIQLFESWALACPEHIYQRAVEAPLLLISAALKAKYPHTPVILFPRGATNTQMQGFLKKEANLPFAGMSLSTETDLLWAHQNLQPHVAIQGNLNPQLMVGEAAPLKQAVTHMLNTAAVKPGYIVNLGHGLTPETKPDNVALVVETIRNWQKP